MATAAHILVVDDEAEIRDMVQEYLTMQGFTVETADGGTAMRRALTKRRPDVVLLDVKMPGEDGLTLARYLREHGRMGVIMVTAAGEVVDRIVGLEVGADDYLAKPFDLRELMARIKSVLRRLAPDAPSGADSGRLSHTEIRFGRCTLNLQTRQLVDEDGKEQALTTMEFDLLKAFALNPNRVLTRDQLLELAHHRSWEPYDRSIDIRITRLRRKIEADATRPQILKTVRGAGYIFVPGGAPVNDDGDPSAS